MMLQALITFRRKILLVYVKLVKYFYFKILLSFFSFFLVKKRWKNLLYYTLIDNHKIVEVHHNNIFYKFYSLSLMTNSRYKNFFNAEPQTIKWINTFKEGMVFWDIGSNIGLYSIYYAKKNINNKVICFEPSVFNLEILSRNIVLNKLENNISIFPLPLNNKAIKNNFNMNNTEYGGALSGFGVDYDENFQKREINFSYQTFSMDLEMFKNIYKVEFPNYLKIDVDGIEQLILEGSNIIFENKKLSSVLIENPNSLESLKSYFNRYNFYLESREKNNEVWVRKSF